MRNSLISISMLFISTISIAQMTRNDSLVSIGLWNLPSWHIFELELKNGVGYSSGKNYIKYVTDSAGRPREAFTYYFNETLAMHSTLYSDLSKLSSAENYELWEFVTTTYYPNGQLRSTEFHFQNTKMKIIYDQEQTHYYTEQIVGTDTLSGFYLSSMDENFNFGYRIYEDHKYIGTIVTDRTFSFFSSFGPITKRQAKRKFQTLKKMNEKPYPGF